MATEHPCIRVVATEQGKMFEYEGMHFPYLDRSVAWDDGRHGIHHATSHSLTYPFPFPEHRVPALKKWIEQTFTNAS